MSPPLGSILQFRPRARSHGTFVNCHENLVVRVGREILIEYAASCLPHALQLEWISNDALDLRGEVRGVTRFEEQASVAIVDDLRHRSQFRSDHGGALGEGFDNDPSECLVTLRWEHQN